MRRLALAAFVLLINSAAFADYVGFSFTSVFPPPLPGQPVCSSTWILPNNAPPDSLSFSGAEYFNVPAANTCSPGVVGAFSSILFWFGGGGGLLFNGVSDYFGPTLFSPTPDGVSFHIGTFNLFDEFDHFVAVLDIHAAPEPAPILLVIGGLVGIFFARRRICRSKPGLGSPRLKGGSSSPRDHENA